MAVKQSNTDQTGSVYRIYKFERKQSMVYENQHTDCRTNNIFQFIFKQSTLKIRYLQKQTGAFEKPSCVTQ